MLATILSIGSIRWPPDKLAALHSYLAFLLEVLDELHVDLPKLPNDPNLVTREFLAGRLSLDDRAEACTAWWTKLDELGALREFRDRNILLARVAICLLAPKIDESTNPAEHLSWFFEVLEFLGYSLDGPIKLMRARFSKA